MAKHSRLGKLKRLVRNNFLCFYFVYFKKSIKFANQYLYNLKTNSLLKR